MPTFSYSPGFEHIVPDSYSCSDGCNSHRFKIIKSSSSYTTYGTYRTMRACLNRVLNDNPKLCLENWMLSNRLNYDAFPNSVNNCINGYRNITYVKKIQKTLDENFSAEQAKTLEHTYNSLHEGICLCNSLFKSLRERGFEEKILSSFGSYLYGLGFPHPKTIHIVREEERIERIKKVFDYITTHPEIINDVVTSEMIDNFYQNYQKYVNR